MIYTIKLTVPRKEIEELIGFSLLDKVYRISEKRVVATKVIKIENKYGIIEHAENKYISVLDIINKFSPGNIECSDAKFNSFEFDKENDTYKIAITANTHPMIKTPIKYDPTRSSKDWPTVKGPTL